MTSNSDFRFGGAETSDSPVPDAPEDDQLSGQVAALQRQVAALSERLAPATRAAQGEVDERSSLVTRGVTVLEHATAQAETIAVRWMQAPAVIGVVLITVGLGLLIMDVATLKSDRDTFWGGIVLIGIGTVSATAVALMARPVADPGRGRSALPPERRLY